MTFLWKHVTFLNLEECLFRFVRFVIHVNPLAPKQPLILACFMPDLFI